MGATGLLSKKTGHQIGHVLGVTHHVAKHYIVGQLESSRYAGPKAIQPGVWCEWWSPLLGHCTGQVVSLTVGGYVVTNHSVIGPHEQVEIPVAWLCGVYREQQTPY